jgi:hypothetical protein
MTPKERLHTTVGGERADRVPVTPVFMAWATHYVDPFVGRDQPFAPGATSAHSAALLAQST